MLSQAILSRRKKTLRYDKIFPIPGCCDQQTPLFSSDVQGVIAQRRIIKFQQRKRAPFSKLLDDDTRSGVDGLAIQLRILRNGHAVSVQKLGHLPQFLIEQFRRFMIYPKKRKAACSRKEQQHSGRQPD
ncbi:MAG TPA: hypothetical protein H9768_03320 [Candidatus Mailhella merdavium]|nr:hypothetical protein [Candidatus Mailhella merdavium]